MHRSPFRSARVTQSWIRNGAVVLGLALPGGLGCSDDVQAGSGAAGSSGNSVVATAGSNTGGASAGESAGGSAYGGMGSAEVAGAGQGGALPSAGAGAGGVAGGGTSAAGSAGSAGGGGAAGTGGAVSGGAAGGGGTGGSPSTNHSLPGTIVVLGSSTAAGTGPKDPKNAWVMRYKTYLAGEFPKFVLVNLAVGGQTTFEIQPSDYKPPANRPKPVEGKNITAALKLKPSAIIINTPTNDQASNFPVSEQLANYDRIAALTTAAHVLLWVATSQPRNFTNAAQLTSLMQVRDAISKKFTPRALDFWTPFAKADGTIKTEYDSGDGTHMNDAAHAILANTVIAAQIPEKVLAQPPY